MKYFNKDGTLQLSDFSGHLHEIAHKTIEREINRIFKADSLDPSYVSFQLMLKVNSLASDDFQPLETVTVDRTPRK